MTSADASFSTRAAQVAAFIKTHGYLPRVSTPTGEERTLGIWVAANRQALRKGTLPPARREIFLALDLTPNKDRHWELKLDRLTEHMEQHGTRPRRHSGDPDEIANAEWLILQLHNLKTGKMKQERQRRFLERFPTGTFRSVISFAERVTALTRFQQEHGRLPLSTRPGEEALATWMIQARMNFKDGTLSADRVAALEAIPGALATNRIANTDTALEELRAWCQEHGHHPRVGAGSGRTLTEDDHTERRIADWTRNHGQGQKTTPESLARQANIRSILANYPGAAAYRQIQTRNLVKESLEHYGYIPKNTEDQKASSWVTGRRSALKAGDTLSPEDLELLEYAESLPTAMDHERHLRLQELEAFVQEHGRMPGFANTAPKTETGLAFWVKRRLDSTRNSGDPSINRRIYQIITDHGMQVERIRRPLDASMADEISAQLSEQGHQLRAGTPERAWLDRYRAMQRAGEQLSAPVLAVLNQASKLPTFQTRRMLDRLEMYRAFTEAHGCPPSHLQGPDGVSLATWARRIRMGIVEGADDIRNEILRIDASLHHAHAA